MLCASDKLYISYLKGNGKDYSPSEIVTDIEQKYKAFKEYDFSYFKDIDLVETDKNAFELMSERFYENTPFTHRSKNILKMTADIHRLNILPKTNL